MTFSLYNLIIHYFIYLFFLLKQKLLQFSFLDVLVQLPLAGDLRAPKGKRDRYWSRIPLYRKYLMMFIIAILSIRQGGFDMNMYMRINDNYSTSC